MRFVLPCVILFLCFSVLLALRLPRLGKRELILVLLYVCSICACLVLSVFSSSWCLRRAAACDCGTPWTFLLSFFKPLSYFKSVGDFCCHDNHCFSGVCRSCRLKIQYCNGKLTKWQMVIKYINLVDTQQLIITAKYGYHYFTVYGEMHFNHFPTITNVKKIVFGNKEHTTD